MSSNMTSPGQRWQHWSSFSACSDLDRPYPESSAAPKIACSPTAGSRSWNDPSAPSTCHNVWQNRRSASRSTLASVRTPWSRWTCSTECPTQSQPGCWTPQNRSPWCHLRSLHSKRVSAWSQTSSRSSRCPYFSSRWSCTLSFLRRRRGSFS